MKILVTGGTGFIGSHTVVELINAGHQVVIVDNLINSKKAVLDRIKQLCGIMPAFYCGSICDQSFLDSVFDKEKIDCVIHFGALKSNAESIRKPGLYFENNLYSSLKLLMAMEKHSVNKIVFSSSATVYGLTERVPIHETDLIGNVISPYGMTKYLNELYLQDYARQHKDFKAIALRYFNPIGAHPSGVIGEDPVDDTPNCLMPYVTRVALKRLPYLSIFGDDYDTFDGTGLRDYIHVVDLALGHVAAVNHFESMKENFDVFNLGTGKGTTVLQLIDAFEKTNQIEVPYKIVGRRPGDVAKSYADVTKAMKILGWKAKFTVIDCVRDSWNWQIHNPNGYDGDMV
jgi:UDP-glucose 4-epimerase